MKTRSGTYLFDEGGGAGSGYCPHGYPGGPVSALWLQRRGSRCCLSGLRCDKRLFFVRGVFIAVRKEKYCSCARCPGVSVKCGNTCYEYPDPDPDPNPGEGGGGGGGRVTPAVVLLRQWVLYQGYF